MKGTDIPNAARVYDYLLGGHHNFEADRQAAGYMLGLLPSIRKWVQSLRVFLRNAVLELASEDVDRFLDLGSGLPTQEHIHACVPRARVVYVDSDPVVVASGTRILDIGSNARYLEADIRQVPVIIKCSLVRDLLGHGLRIAIGFNAVTCFLTDNEIHHIAQSLHDWAPRGSKLFFSFETKLERRMTPAMRVFMDVFYEISSPCHFLTVERAKRLLQPWTADNRGFRSLSELPNLPEPFKAEDREGVGLDFVGVTLVK